MGLRELLSCFGHYGYASGWSESHYCRDSCSVHTACWSARKEVTGKTSGQVCETVVVEQERRFGAGDRMEGQSRYGHQSQRLLSGARATEEGRDDKLLAKRSGGLLT